MQDKGLLFRGRKKDSKGCEEKKEKIMLVKQK
jgi:hypothetical protein